MLTKPSLPPDYDPSGPGQANDKIFGLPFTAEQSNLILIPVPWEATTSYGRGTAQGPRSILHASPQLDLFDAELQEFGLPRPWQYGIFLEPENAEIQRVNQAASDLSLPIIEKGGAPQEDPALQQVNAYSQQVNDFVKARVAHYRQQGKIVGLVGGEHSTPFGAIQLLAEEYSLGVLQIDAHADLRQAYEGFTHSHASIAYNLLHHTRIEKLVQVGIRDYSEEEHHLATTHPKVKTYFDHQIKDRTMQGETWHALCHEVVSQLPEHVYVTFDIDGLEPALCPHTGTPVPGGLTFHQAVYLLKTLHQQGKKLVAFDLNEVAPGPDGEWDGNVGARLLYKLCGLALLSAGAQEK